MLTLNGALLASMPALLTSMILDAGIIPGSPTDLSQLGVTIEGTPSHVLVSARLIGPHGFDPARCTAVIEVNRETGDAVYSTIEAFAAGLPYADWTKQRYAKRAQVSS